MDPQVLRVDSEEVVGLVVVVDLHLFGLLSHELFDGPLDLVEVVVGQKGMKLLVFLDVFLIVVQKPIFLGHYFLLEDFHDEEME